MILINITTLFYFFKTGDQAEGSEVAINLEKLMTEIGSHIIVLAVKAEN